MSRPATGARERAGQPLPSPVRALLPVLLPALLLPFAASCSEPGGRGSLPGARAGVDSARTPGATPRTRVVSLDYGLTETLLGLGVVPVGVPDREGWKTWVVEPELPASVVDVGSTFEPNLELIQQLEPDLILTTPFLAGLRDRLERIAPTLSLPIYTRAGEPYRQAQEVARRLGERLDREEAAESLIARTDSTIRAARLQLEGADRMPLYLVRFMDPRHVRVFGENSLYDDVLERLGVPNAWDGDTNYWGFSTVGIEALATERRVRLFYLTPPPPDVLPTLEESRLWAHLPFVEAGRIHPFPMVLSFGGLPAAARFAELLTRELNRIDADSD